MSKLKDLYTLLFVVKQCNQTWTITNKHLNCLRWSKLVLNFTDAILTSQVLNGMCLKACFATFRKQYCQGNADNILLYLQLTIKRLYLDAQYTHKMLFPQMSPFTLLYIERKHKLYSTTCKVTYGALNSNLIL